LDWLTTIGPSPVFFVSVHSKGRLSGLFCYIFVSVHSKGLRGCPETVHFDRFAPLGVRNLAAIFLVRDGRGKTAQAEACATKEKRQLEAGGTKWTITCKVVQHIYEFY
jgi:hypothetical protein